MHAGKKYFSDSRGVKPLVKFYEDGTDFSEFSCADKAVGRGAAFMYLLLGVKKLYADVISKPALTLLKDNGIYVEYSELVDNIINRTRDGICPFELAVLEINDSTEAYNAIRQKMQELNSSL